MINKYNVKLMNKIRREKLLQINLIGFILSVTAGWVNAVGVNLFLSESPSFMSGRGLVLGYAAFTKDTRAFLSILIVILSFILGATISTLITKKRGLSGGLLFVGILLGVSAFPFSLRKLTIDTVIISMSMGSLNASTSLTPINRTTHLTGPATDIGINIANGNWRLVIFWMLRWISFPLGAVIGFVLIDMHNKQIISLSFTLFLPALTIFLISFIQKKFLHIPLLNKTDIY